MENVQILWLMKEKLDTSSECIEIFFTYGKMQESGLLEIIPLISLTRTSISSFCLKSVVWATMVAAVVTKDSIVGILISSRVSPGFTFMDECNGLWLQCPLFTDMDGKFFGSQCALLSTTSEKVTICKKMCILSQKVTVGIYLNRTYRGPKVMHLPQQNIQRT